MRTLHIFLKETAVDLVDDVTMAVKEAFPDVAATVVAYGTPRRGFVLTPNELQPEEVAAISDIVAGIIHE